MVHVHGIRRGRRHGHGRPPGVIPGDVGRGAGTRDPLAVAATWSRWLVVGTVVVAGGHVVGLPAMTAPIALVVAVVGLVAGVPHGAADHVMATRLAGGRPMPLVVGAYAGVAVAAWALLQWAGPIALVLVVSLSALHFGLGELEVSRQLTGWRPPPVVAAGIVDRGHRRAAAAPGALGRSADGGGVGGLAGARRR